MKFSDLRIPGTNRQFCPHCSIAKEQSEFESSHIFCRTCDLNRFGTETIRQNCADRRLEFANRLLWLLGEGRDPDAEISTGQKRQLRNLVIHLAATDRDFRDAVLADLDMLRERQARITHVSAAHDVQDVLSRA